MAEEKKPTEGSKPAESKPAEPKRAGTVALKGNRALIFAAKEKLERAGLKVVEGQEPKEGEKPKKGEPVTLKAAEGFACPVCDNTTDFSLVSNGVRCNECRNTLLLDSRLKNHWQRK